MRACFSPYCSYLTLQPGNSDAMSAANIKGVAPDGQICAPTDGTAGRGELKAKGVGVGCDIEPEHPIGEEAGTVGHRAGG